MVQAVEMTMRALVLVQQFTHLVCISIALASHSENYPRLSYLLSDKTKKCIKRKQRNTIETSKQYTRQDVPLDRKIMVSLLTSGVKLLALLGSPCCHPSLLPLLRQRRIFRSRCVTASSLIRIDSRRRQLVASTSAMIFLTSLSWIDIFSKLVEKRSVTRVYLTCSPLQGAVLKAASRSPGSLGFPGNSSSRDARSSDRCLLRTGALLCSTLDRWRLGGELTALLQKPPKFLPSCPSGWGRSLLIPGQPPVADVLMAQSSCSFDRCLLSHWRFFAALSAGSSAGGT